MEIIILIILIFIQSVFGVGLLLFGTPTFLFLNYSFSETLFLLLPLSLTISLVQFFNSNKKDKKFIKKFNLFTLPFLIIGQIIILSFQEIINLKIFISLMLIFLSIISLFFKKFEKFNFTNTYKNIYLIFLGIIHGLTNLGGGFLVIYSNILSKNDKNLVRYYISYGYLLMVFFQLFVLFIFYNSEFNFSNLYNIILVLLIYFPSQLIYKKINPNNFTNIIKIIALIYGSGALVLSVNTS